MRQFNYAPMQICAQKKKSRMKRANWWMMYVLESWAMGTLALAHFYFLVWWADCTTLCSKSFIEIQPSTESKIEKTNWHCVSRSGDNGQKKERERESKSVNVSAIRALGLSDNHSAQHRHLSLFQWMWVCACVSESIAVHFNRIENSNNWKTKQTLSATLHFSSVPFRWPSSEQQVKGSNQGSHKRQKQWRKHSTAARKAAVKVWQSQFV